MAYTRNHIHNIYSRGDVIQQIIKHKLHHNKEGSLSAYVMIMFGLIIILYLFGFHSLWTDYQNFNSLETTSTSEKQYNILETLIHALTDPNNLAIVGGGIATLIIVSLVTRLIFGSQAVSTLLSFAIPLAFLLILNIFIFPLSGISADLGFLDATGITITVFLFAFFNLFYILSVIEFIRGQPT